MRGCNEKLMGGNREKGTGTSSAAERDIATVNYKKRETRSRRVQSLPYVIRGSVSVSPAADGQYFIPFGGERFLTLQSEGITSLVCTSPPSLSRLGTIVHNCLMCPHFPARSPRSTFRC